MGPKSKHETHFYFIYTHPHGPKITLYNTFSMSVGLVFFVQAGALPLEPLHQLCFIFLRQSCYVTR
jgi:hypothetical protein